MPNQCDKNARILQCSAGYILRSKAFAVRLCLWYSFTRNEQSYYGTPALKHPLRSRKRYLLTLAAFAVLALYSSQRERRGWKSFFYAFYPAHFLVLLWIGKWIAAQSL